MPLPPGTRLGHWRGDVTLPLPDTGVTLGLSPDGRTVYYGGLRAEADNWSLERLKAEG
jgi:hypothetical protein